MDEIIRVADKLIAAYGRELHLVQAWQYRLEEQQQAIEAGTWEILNRLIAAAVPWREKISQARQTTLQLEGLLEVVSGSKGPDWESVDLPPATLGELVEAARRLHLTWEACHQLQAANTAKMQQALATARNELDQIQTARQMARAYHQGSRAIAPRCLDLQL